MQKFINNKHCSLYSHITMRYVVESFYINYTGFPCGKTHSFHQTYLIIIFVIKFAKGAYFNSGVLTELGNITFNLVLKYNFPP